MLFISSSLSGPNRLVSVEEDNSSGRLRAASRPQPSRDITLKYAIPGELLLWIPKAEASHIKRGAVFRSLCATTTLMKYINAHIPQHLALLLLLFLILLPAWTHEGRKWRGVFERKTGVPMGILHKERKGMERREDGSVGNGGSEWRQTVSQRQG